MSYVTNIDGPDYSGNYRATMSDGKVITFGPSHSHGDDHWFVSVPSGERDYSSGHTTFIIKTREGIWQSSAEWVIQQIKSKGSDKDFWRAYAVSVLGS